jgi:ketosteroid isomerase-like protein
VSENLDLVRSILAPWERGEVNFDQWNPEMEFVVVDGPEPGSRTGLAARRWVEAFLTAWESVRFEVSEYRELDDRRVLVVFDARGRGKGSGIEVDQRRASVVHVDQGKVTKIVNYWDRDRAFADLGLEE